MDEVKQALDKEMAKTNPNPDVVKVLAQTLADADRDAQMFGYAERMKTIEMRTAMWNGLLR